MQAFIHQLLQRVSEDHAGIAQQKLGFLCELLPRHELLPRAWELAQQLAKKPEFLLRYTRMVLTHPLRKLMDEGLQYSLALETLGALDKR